ncbi:MAG TPA: hypothetical protein DCQ93_06600 [Bacteroidetes bacterium]|nr:hypothetical protein [Bacteroidota bacterium]
MKIRYFGVYGKTNELLGVVKSEQTDEELVKVADKLHDDGFVLHKISERQYYDFNEGDELTPEDLRNGNFIRMDRGARLAERHPKMEENLIDKTIMGLKKKFTDSAENILNQETDKQRDELISWIKNQKENVKLIIAFSGGKDSVAMVLYALFVLKVPKEQIELWHHEVDGMGEHLFDWKCTPSYCRAFAKAFGVTNLFSYANGGILREIFRENETIQPIYFQEKQNGEYIEVKPKDKAEFKSTRRKFPAVSADLNTRWCSWIAKIGVMNKAINNMSRYKNANIVVLTGERRQESTARSRYNEIEPYRSMSKTRRAIAWRPIIDWSEKQVWGIIEAHRVQPHPCYMLGWNRCSCQLCIFSSANAWASIFEISPEKVLRINEIEKELGFTLYRDKNIWDAKVTNGNSFIPEDMKARWLDEALDEFISPIVIEDWKLPAGAFKTETMGAN